MVFPQVQPNPGQGQTLQGGQQLVQDTPAGNPQHGPQLVQVYKELIIYNRAMHTFLDTGASSLTVL